MASKSASGGGSGLGAATLVITIGGILVYSALKGISVVDVLSGVVTGDTLDPHGASVSSESTDTDSPSAADIITDPASIPGGFSRVPGFATFDGHQVPAWMVPWLKKSREAGWKGIVKSGVRTPGYSQQLCYNMCGAPSCPGRCAGLSSNHNMTRTQTYPAGAIDVTDEYNFAAIQKRIGSPLKNDLPQDRVHFSVSGH